MCDGLVFVKNKIPVRHNLWKSWKFIAKADKRSRKINKHWKSCITAFNSPDFSRNSWISFRVSWQILRIEKITATASSFHYNYAGVGDNVWYYHWYDWFSCWKDWFDVLTWDVFKIKSTCVIMMCKINLLIYRLDWFYGWLLKMCW